LACHWQQLSRQTQYLLPELLLWTASCLLLLLLLLLRWQLSVRLLQLPCVDCICRSRQQQKQQLNHAVVISMIGVTPVSCCFQYDNLSYVYGSLDQQTAVLWV
jgi:hypothetical protein